MSNNLSILFAGVGKNFAQSVPLITQACASFDEYLVDWRFLIYENNSDVVTKKALLELANFFDKVIVWSEDLTEDDLLSCSKGRCFNQKPSRIEMISRARNCLMEMVERPEYESFPYVVFLDLDHTSPIPIQRIIKTVNRHKGKFDALISNGIDEYRRMYDAYSYRDKFNYMGPEILGENFWNPKNIAQIMKRYWIFFFGHMF